jgi:hypothetical protein
LKVIGNRYAAGKMRIELVVRHDILVLSVEAHGKAAVSTQGFSPLDADSGTNAPLSSVRARTIISGGDLAIARDDAKGITFHASWRL